MTKKASFTIKHRDDFDRNGKWYLARRSLGISAFGMNLVEISTGDSIPEHTEAGGNQEEVFIILEGTPDMIIEGKSHVTKPGTFISVEPELKRMIKNNSREKALVLIVSAPKSSGYKPPSWA